MDSIITANESVDKKNDVYPVAAPGTYIEEIDAPGLPVFVGLDGARWTRRAVPTRPGRSRRFWPYDAGFATGYATALALCYRNAERLIELRRERGEA